MRNRRRSAEELPARYAGPVLSDGTATLTTKESNRDIKLATRTTGSIRQRRGLGGSVMILRSRRGGAWSSEARRGSHLRARHDPAQFARADGLGRPAQVRLQGTITVHEVRELPDELVGGRGHRAQTLQAPQVGRLAQRMRLGVSPLLNFSSTTSSSCRSSRSPTLATAIFSESIAWPTWLP
jgi:hypothetical protein